MNTEFWYGVSWTLAVLIVVGAILYATGHFHVYGTGPLGVGRLFCIW